MKALISAEIYKLFKQSKTYYGLGAIFLIEVIVLFSAYTQGQTILDVLLDNLKDAFYFEGNLLNGNLLVYLILNTLWFHLPLILIILVSGTVTSEYKDRTLLTVMLQPVSKWKFILSKFVVAILFTIFIVLFLAITSFVLCYSFFGHGDLIVYLDSLNFFESQEAFTRLKYAFISGTISMIFFSVISVTLAIILEESAKTWIAAAFFLIISNLILKANFQSEFINKWFYAKLNDSWQYFFYYEIPWNKIYWNNGIIILYTIITMGLGVYIFNKKDIA